MISKNLAILIVISLIKCSILALNNNYKLIHIPQENNGAKCIDGTAPTIYVKNTVIPLSQKKILIYFTGGGFAHEKTEQQVYGKILRRYKSKHGSNKYSKQYAQIEGIMSDNIIKNPHFYDYTVIFVNYCDGTAFTGHLDEPIIYKGKELWVRGQDNMLATLDYVKNYYKLEQADRVVVGGTSSGAVVVYNWIDYISNYVKKLNPKTQVVALADAGMFLNYKKFGTDIYEFLEKQKNLYIYTRDLEQEQPYQNKKCIEKYQDEPWKCIIAQYLIEFIETPILIVNSSFDNWIIYNVLGIKCINKNHFHDYTGCNEDEIEYIEQFHLDYINEIQSIKQRAKNAQIILLPCINHDNLNKHVYYFAESETTQPPIQLAQLVGQFAEQENIEIDGIDYKHWQESLNCELLRQQVWNDFDRIQFYDEYKDGELQKMGF